MQVSDIYKTVRCPSKEVLYKEKNSKFFGYVFPFHSESEVKSIIAPLRKKHFNAVHFCYAYQMGAEIITFRANDDGEPTNSAGMPIYGQIQSFGITNVLVVVVRFFGGTKLGVVGLISAYKATAQMAIESSEIIEKTIDVEFIINCEYINLNKVMRVIKERNLEIIDQQMVDKCQIKIATRKKDAEMIYGIFDSMYGIDIQ